MKNPFLVLNYFGFKLAKYSKYSVACLAVNCFVIFSAYTLVAMAIEYVAIGETFYHWGDTIVLCVIAILFFNGTEHCAVAQIVLNKKLLNQLTEMQSQMEEVTKLMNKRE